MWNHVRDSTYNNFLKYFYKKSISSRLRNKKCYYYDISIYIGHIIFALKNVAYATFVFFKYALYNILRGKNVRPNRTVKKVE
jgi:hypothetical protein